MSVKVLVDVVDSVVAPRDRTKSVFAVLGCRSRGHERMGQLDGEGADAAAAPMISTRRPASRLRRYAGP